MGSNERGRDQRSCHPPVPAMHTGKCLCSPPLTIIERLKYFFAMVAPGKQDVPFDWGVDVRTGSLTVETAVSETTVSKNTLKMLWQKAGMAADFIGFAITRVFWNVRLARDPRRIQTRIPPNRVKGKIDFRCRTQNATCWRRKCLHRELLMRTGFTEARNY